MPESLAGVYGKQLGDCFGFDEAPDYIAIEQSGIAVTQIRCDVENNGLTAPIPIEDAFLITFHLRHCPSHDLWIDGKACRTGPLDRGDVSIYDLRTNPMVNSTSAFRNLHVYVPRAAFDSIVGQEGLAPVDELPNEPGIGARDPVMRGLGLALEDSFVRPTEMTRLYVDHVTSAIVAQAARSFGTRRGRVERAGVLSAAQERVATEMLAADLIGHVSTAELAEACGMSLSGFRCGFQRATGTMPHQWLTLRRLDRAAALLARTRLRMSEIARRSGFADERHMRRVFRVLHGRTPESYRG